jgi:uncharacterized protein YkwD
VPRKILTTAAALLALAVPATATARTSVTAERVMIAQDASGSHTFARAASRPKVPASCPNADVAPTSDNLAGVRAAIVCLHNQIRAKNGLPLLKGNTRLRHAAEGHAVDMVQAGYFSHTSKSGATMVDRILAAGYVRSDQGWLLGENLEWGTGTMATPRGAVDAWMNSPGHRANILKRGYRHLGIGITLGNPFGDAGVTYAVDFGARD